MTQDAERSGRPDAFTLLRKRTLTMEAQSVVASVAPLATAAVSARMAAVFMVLGRERWNGRSVTVADAVVS